MLKISVRNSRFTLSENRKRLLKIRSNCLKLGPFKAFRGRFPNVPAAGIANAAGFKKFRSLFKYGLMPGSKFGRRNCRDAPPPGELTTAVKPTGKGCVPLTDGNCAVKPCGTVMVVVGELLMRQPAAAAQTTETSGRVMVTSTGKPERALTIVPISQLPRMALPTPPKSYFLPLRSEEHT